MTKFCGICGKDEGCFFVLTLSESDFWIFKNHICQSCYSEKILPLFKEGLSKRSEEGVK